ncbi:MAG: hypothetical protein ABJA94_08865 [Rhodoglobus sp.]
MKFLAVVTVLGQLALAAMAALIVLAALLLIANLAFPQLLGWLSN